MRSPIHVRDAVPADAGPLVEMWHEQIDDDTNRFSATDEDTAGRCIARFALDPEERLVVAEVDGQIVGVAQLSREAVSPIHEETTVRVSHLFVRESNRRRGVGRVLLSAAAAWADEKESTHVLATVSASSRDANRFLARLGLGQVGNVRGVPVGAMRERLDQLGSRPSLRGQVAAVRRRTLRRRQASARAARDDG